MVGILHVREPPGSNRILSNASNRRVVVTSLLPSYLDVLHCGTHVCKHVSVMSACLGSQDMRVHSLLLLTVRPRGITLSLSFPGLSFCDSEVKRK